MNRLHALFLTAVASATIAVPANASLLFNGDFETPDQAPNTLLPFGTHIDGWTVLGSGVSVNIHQVHQASTIWPGKALDDQFADLSGNQGGGSLMSDSFTTVPGQLYKISFQAYNGSLVYNQGQTGVPYTGDIVSVFAGNGPAKVFTSTDLPAGSEAILNYFFTAPSTSTHLFLQDLTGADSNANWIDNVSLTAVPEASTVLAGALLLLPLAMSALRIVRKQSLV